MSPVARTRKGAYGEEGLPGRDASSVEAPWGLIDPFSASWTKRYRASTWSRRRSAGMWLDQVDNGRPAMAIAQEEQRRHYEYRDAAQAVRVTNSLQRPANERGRVPGTVHCRAELGHEENDHSNSFFVSLGLEGFDRRTQPARDRTSSEEGGRLLLRRTPVIVRRRFNV